MKSSTMTYLLALACVLCIFVILYYYLKKPSGKNLTKVEVNSAFEENPPIASEIFLQQLATPIDGGSVLITAKFPKGAIKKRYHAILLDDSTKLVFRDDGAGGDEKGNDNIFSLVIKEEPEKIKLELRQAVQLIKSQKTLHNFSDRSAEIIKPDELLREFPAGNEINLTKRIPLDIFRFDIAAEKEIASIRSHSLVITHPGVIRDTVRSPNPCVLSSTPPGAWSMGTLLTEMANEPVTGINPVDFTLNWFSLWQQNAIVNGDTIRARAISQAIGTWHFLSGPGQPLKMKNLPFVLTAIVNRLDLRGNSGYGFTNAGEARLVYTAIDHECNITFLPFNIIFEYGVNKKTCAEIMAYAQDWADLQSETVGSAAYNTKLQAITDQFTRAGTNPSKPNQSSLNQVRSNEVVLGSPWELREFVLADSTHTLEATTVKQEPSTRHNVVNLTSLPHPTPPDIERLVKFINDNEISVRNNNYTVPEFFDGAPFRGGKGHTIDAFAYHWNGSSNPAETSRYILDDKARHIFSLNTCSGCHGGEAKTNSFMHVDPFSHLSGFMTGLGADDNPSDDDTDPTGLYYVNDPSGRPTGSPAQRGFNDLDRRAHDFHMLITRSCGRASLFEIVRVLKQKPLHMVH